MQQLTVLAHERGLHGGGAGVDADEHASGVAFELALGDDLGVVAGLELGKVLVGGKERIQTLDLGTCVSPRASMAPMSCGNVLSLLDSCAMAAPLATNR